MENTRKESKMAGNQDFEKDFVRLKNVSKIYRMGEVEIRAVDKIEFAIDKGEFVVVVGPSGAGKTTVLNILGGMDTVTSGDVLVDGENIAKYSQRKLTGYRRDDIGFVFQFYNLVPNLTAKENVELALQICKEPLDAVQVLKEVGLGNRLDNFPAQLSGGEQQRVSIARALAKNPKLLLCDEPTGALDYQTGKAILKLLQDTCRQKKMTVIVITHNSALTPMAVLHKIHCPSLFTELMHMIYRYIFILLEVQHNMQISAEARLGFCDFRTSCYSFGQIAANLFIVALKKANAYYDAMEARCYDGTLCFLEEKKKLPLPYIIASGTFFLFLVVLWLFIR